MPQFSRRSLDQLETCHPDLQRLFKAVIKHVDCTVIEGHRGKEAQNKAFAEGHSQKKWPNGNHNKFPSLAVDVVPFPLDWKDDKAFKALAVFVQATARSMKINIKWGGDWKTLKDMPHYELVLEGK